MASQSVLATTTCGELELRWGERTYVMGILNITPDSFSGDGLADDVKAAVARAKQMAEDGADIIDIGGESTRPAARPVSAEEELRRIIPVIERLAGELSVPMSIDTTKSEVAQRALEAGARMLNDQWGLKRDPRLAELAVDWKAPIVLMSNQRDKGGYDDALKRDTADYKDPITEVINSLKGSLKIASEAGIPPENIIIDPGIGFGKSWRHDLEIVRRLAELTELGKPILLGPSGKSFIGKALDLPVAERLQGTAAAVAIGIAHGADMVRVHDVKPIVRVCRMSDAIIRRRQIGN
ncbi:MAG TPA: dihydropteroate synthase [Dehalococcoidales bacterium]|nr:dihydropteroate synthase [Dehalococcoidales bacterium]